MYIILWKYRVKTQQVAEFEKTYASNGTWVDLFQKQAGYLGTELLRDPEDNKKYITIDRWASPRDYESFLFQWKKEYDELGI